MARTVIDLTNATINGVTDMVANATTIDAALVSAGAVVEMGLDMRVFVYVVNTAVAADITISGTDAYGSGEVADYTVEIAQDNPTVLGPFASDLYEQTDGNLYIDFETGFTGSIVVVQIPKA